VDVEANRRLRTLSRTDSTAKRKEEERGKRHAHRFYLAQLQRTAPYFPATVRYGVVDGFYAKEKFVSGIHTLNYHLNQPSAR
jgi:hypothetical protein